VQLASFFAVGVYQGVWRHFSASDAVTIVRGTLIGTLASALIFLYMFPPDPTAPTTPFSRTVLIIYAIVVVLMITGSRASFRVISELLQRRRHTGSRIVVYGAGDGGAMAVRELLSNPDHDVRIVGFSDDDARKRRMRVRGYPVLGPYETLCQLIVADSIDGVVLSTRAIGGVRLTEIEAMCAEHAIQLSRLVVGLEPVAAPQAVSASAAASNPKIRKFPTGSRGD